MVLVVDQVVEEGPVAAGSLTFLSYCYHCRGIARVVRVDGDVGRWDTVCLECPAVEMKTDMVYFGPSA